MIIFVEISILSQGTVVPFTLNLQAFVGIEAIRGAPDDDLGNPVPRSIIHVVGPGNTGRLYCPWSKSLLHQKIEEEVGDAVRKAQLKVALDPRSQR